MRYALRVTTLQDCAVPVSVFEIEIERVKETSGSLRVRVSSQSQCPVWYSNFNNSPPPPTPNAAGTAIRPQQTRVAKQNVSRALFHRSGVGERGGNGLKPSANKVQWQLHLTQALWQLVAVIMKKNNYSVAFIHITSTSTRAVVCMYMYTITRFKKIDVHTAFMQ